MNDIVIGTGNRLNSSVPIYSIPTFKDGNSFSYRISEDRNCYWVSDCILDLSMTIFKDTEEGKFIKLAIDNSIEYEKMKEYLDLLCIAHCKDLRNRIIDKFELHGNSEFERGKSYKAKEIRKALGL